MTWKTKSLGGLTTTVSNAPPPSICIKKDKKNKNIITSNAEMRTNY